MDSQGILVIVESILRSANGTMYIATLTGTINARQLFQFELISYFWRKILFLGKLFFTQPKISFKYRKAKMGSLEYLLLNLSYVNVFFSYWHNIWSLQLCTVLDNTLSLHQCYMRAMWPQITVKPTVCWTACLGINQTQNRCMTGPLWRESHLAKGQ